MASLSRLSEIDLAEKLFKEGPYKKENTGRRVRALLGGKWMFDTLEAQYVWEHPYYPFFYIPLKDLEGGPGQIQKQTPEDAGYWTGTLSSGNESAKVMGFVKGPLEGLVKIRVSDAEWFVEDEKLLGGHPKDPYKRIEIFPSTRDIRIEVDGVLVAQSNSNMFLYETSLRTRHYLSATAVKDWSLLTKSATTTFCPYKGQAEYYHLKVGDRLIEDAVWYYTYPTHESTFIAGRLCFYNDKVDVFVDGVKEQK
ncbi:unnamed protein product [Discula destructiva]